MFYVWFIYSLKWKTEDRNIAIKTMEGHCKVIATWLSGWSSRPVTKGLLVRPSLLPVSPWALLSSSPLLLNTRKVLSRGWIKKREIMSKTNLSMEGLIKYVEINKQAYNII